MNKIQMDMIQLVINIHRNEMFTTCVKTCPCWHFQKLIDKWMTKYKEAKG